MRAGLGARLRRAEGGYAMAALLVSLSVMAVVMSVALPVWQTAAQREREAELIFRGEQYARAVALYQRSRGAFPPSIDVLVEERFLRKKYADPMTEDGEFQVIYVGQGLPGQGDDAETGAGRQAGAGAGALTGAGRVGGGGGGGAVLGVTSKSKQDSLRVYNGRSKYNEWAFVAVQATQQAWTPAGAPGGRGAEVGRGRGGAAGLGAGGRAGRGGRARGAGPGLPAPRGNQPSLGLPGRGQPR